MVTEKERNEASDWTKQPPYRIHEEPEHFKVVYEASCHCGKVTYQLNREKPLDAKFCHCMTCQRQHGASFQWAAIFHKTDINFTNGFLNLECYDPTTKTTEHKLPCKVRCSHCHSPIMDEGRNMILIFPALIHFKSDEEKARFRPSCHMFYGARVADINDGLPKWSGLDYQSDLIADSPPEAINEYRKKQKADKEKKEDENVEGEHDK